MQNQTIQVCPDAFKQMIFDLVIDSQKLMMPEVKNALISMISYYSIGPIWIDMSNEKPSRLTEWYWIKTKKKRKYDIVMPAKRVSGGFLYGLLPNQPENGRMNRVYMIPDLAIEQYSPIFLPK
mgnify:FL=1